MKKSYYKTLKISHFNISTTVVYDIDNDQCGSRILIKRVTYEYLHLLS